MTANVVEDALPGSSFEQKAPLSNTLGRLRSTTSTATSLQERTVVEKGSQNSKRRVNSRRSARIEQDRESDIGEDLLTNVTAVAENFDIISKAGEGTFSTVYVATVKGEPAAKFALKHVIPTSAPSRIENELKCLQELGGQSNVIELKTTIREKDHIVFVLPYFKHDKFQDYVRIMSTEDIKDYMRNLFQSLKLVHQYNIIHRDVKPSNFLHSRAERKYVLVDFGLAMQVPGTKGLLTQGLNAASKPDKKKTLGSWQPSTRQHLINGNRSASSKENDDSSQIVPRCGDRKRQASAGTRKSALSDDKHLCPSRHTRSEICQFCTTRSGQVAPRAGTPGFRSPEVLAKYPQQTTAVDVWSAGVILLSILSGRHPFFKAQDDLTALAQIISIFGTKKVADSGISFGKEITSSPNVAGHNLKDMCKKLKRRRCTIHEASINKRRTKDHEDNTILANETSLATVVPGLPHLDLEEREEGSSRTVTVDDSPRLRHKRKRNEMKHERSCCCIPDEAYDLLLCCLDLNPRTRITAGNALDHPFLRKPDT